MSKLQDIRNLIQEHAVSVSSSPGDWMDYIIWTQHQGYIGILFQTSF